MKRYFCKVDLFYQLMRSLRRFNQNRPVHENTLQKTNNVHMYVRTLYNTAFYTYFVHFWSDERRK